MEAECLFCERVFLEVHMVEQDRAQYFAPLVDMGTCRQYGSEGTDVSREMMLWARVLDEIVFRDRGYN